MRNHNEHPTIESRTNPGLPNAMYHTPYNNLKIFGKGTNTIFFQRVHTSFSYGFTLNTSPTYPHDISLSPASHATILQNTLDIPHLVNPSLPHPRPTPAAAAKYHKTENQESPPPHPRF